MPTTTMPAATFQSPTRVMTSVLATSERRILLWLAHRMPGWVNSDHLTALALAAMVGAGGAFWLARVTPLGLLLVVVCLGINWFGDSLDGTLARVRNQQRPRYGHYVDHVVDVAGTACLLGGMALSGFMTPVLALAVLAAYLMVTAEAFLATHARGVFTMSHFGVGPTELRILLAGGALAVVTHPKVKLFGEAILLFNVGGAVAVAGLLVTFVRAAVANGRALYEAEPLPSAPHDRREHPPDADSADPAKNNGAVPVGRVHLPRVSGVQVPPGSWHRARNLRALE